MKSLLFTFILFSFHFSQGQQAFFANNYTQAVAAPWCSGQGVNAASEVAAFKTRLTTAGYTLTSTEETYLAEWVQMRSDSCAYTQVYECWFPFLGSGRALIGFKGHGNLTEVGSINYTAQGASGGGTGYYTSTLTPAVVSTQYSASIGSYVTVMAASSWRWSNGVTSGSNGMFQLLDNSYDYSKVNATSQTYPVHNNSYTSGALMHYRTSDTARRMYHQAAEMSVTSMPAVAPSSLALYFMAINENGTANYKTSSRCALFQVGGGYTTRQAAAANKADNLLMTRFGINTY